MFIFFIHFFITCQKCNENSNCCTFMGRKYVILWTLSSPKLHLRTKSNFFFMSDFFVSAESFIPNPQVARNTLDFFHLWGEGSGTAGKKLWFFCLLAQAIGVPVSRGSGSQLAMTLVATKNVIIFFSFSPVFFSFFPPSQPFLIERAPRSKILFCESCLERPKT